MTTLDEAGRLQRSSEVEDIERLYETVGPMLLRTLKVRYGVSEEEAQSLVQDTFVAYLTVSSIVSDGEAWLIGAACNSGRAHQESRMLSEGIETPPPDATAEETRAVTDVLFAREALAALAALPERGRAALRLRFYEHKTYAQIAAELGISEFYVQSLVAKSLARLRAFRQRRQEEQES